MPHIEPTVDLADPTDVVTRGWLRGFNGIAWVASFGKVGQFSDDPLMQEALKTGVINRETIGFMLALLVEASVVFTAFVLARSGAAPFSENLVDWIRTRQARNPEPDSLQRLLLGAAKAAANVLYAEQPAESARPTLAVQPPAPDASTFGDVDLGPDPAFPSRETLWSEELLAWHFPWADRDFLILPLTADTRRARTMAHALRARGVVSCLSSTATHSDLADKRPVARHMQEVLGDRWKTVDYEVFEVAAAFAQVLRLALIGPDRPRALPTPAAQDAHPSLRHKPLRRKLAERQLGLV